MTCTHACTHASSLTPVCTRVHNLLSFIFTAVHRPSATDSDFLTDMGDRGEVTKEPPMRLHLYTIPGVKAVAKAKEVMMLEGRLWKVLHDVGLCILFGSFLAIVARRQRQSASFVLNKSVADTFLNARYSRNITLNEVCHLILLNITVG